MRHSFLDNLKELLVHQFNLNNAIGREAAAAGMGLPQPERFAHPYPGSTNNIFVVDSGNKPTDIAATPPVIPPTPKPVKRGMGLWAAAGLGLLAGLLPTAIGLAAWWSQQPTAPGQQPVPPGMKRIIEESKDGGKTWTPIPVVKE